MDVELEQKTEAVLKAFAELDEIVTKFLRHLGGDRVDPLCKGHVQTISRAADGFAGQCLDTPYIVRWGTVVVDAKPALAEFEFVAKHASESVVLTRVYLGPSGRLSLDSHQLVPLCEYDDPKVARALASLVLTGLLSSVIYAPRDRLYAPNEREDVVEDGPAVEV